MIAARGMDSERPPSKRILFVDDEERVLLGLRRMLRPKRRDWTMVFAPGPEAALRELEESPFDVIVSDMRMPGMDGAELLGRAKAMQPGSVRIVLSGHSEEACAWRALSVSHRFLAKPCRPEELVSVVERACSLHRLLSSEDLRRLVGDIDTLSTAQKTYVELSRLLDNPEAGLPAVARIVEGDVALSAKLLQITNSSYFGLRQSVSSVAAAVNYVGVAAIRHLALASGAQKAIGAPQAEADRLQVHSLLVAQMARLVAPDPATREAGLSAAFLHDIGKLVVARELASSANGIDCEEERSRFGASHAEIGAYLLGLWGIPYDLVEAVAHHHSGPSSNEFGLNEVMFAAEALAEEAEGNSQDRLDEAAQLAGWTDQVDEWRREASRSAE